MEAPRESERGRRPDRRRNWDVAPLALVGDGTKVATQVALVRQRGGGAADGEAAAAGRYARRYLFQLKREGGRRTTARGACGA